jgi:hypothetical protein
MAGGVLYPSMVIRANEHGPSFRTAGNAIASTTLPFSRADDRKTQRLVDITFVSGAWNFRVLVFV